MSNVAKFIMIMQNYVFAIILIFEFKEMSRF